MPMYWFFDFDGVTQRYLFLKELGGTQTFREALGRVVEFTSRLPRRPGCRVPL
jgi:hypothetical protein